MRRVSCGPQRRSDPHLAWQDCWRRSRAANRDILAGMTLSPDDLPNDIERLKALLLAARSRERRDRRRNLASEPERSASRISCASFAAHTSGASRSGSSEDQLNLGLEDVETAFAAEDAKAEQADATSSVAQEAPQSQSRPSAGASAARGDRHRAAEQDVSLLRWGVCTSSARIVSERLDKVPAKLRVIVTRRPKYACRSCERTGADDVAGVIQAPAPRGSSKAACRPRRSSPTCSCRNTPITCRCIAKSQILARDGIDIDRSTLAHWVGFAAFELEPLHARLVEILKSSTKLFCRRDTLPRARSGARQDQDRLPVGHRARRSTMGRRRSAGSRLHLRTRPRRRARRALLAGFSGTLQVDGYVAYNGLRRCRARRRRAWCSPIAGATSAASSTTSPRAATRRSRPRRSTASARSTRIEAEIRGRDAERAPRRTAGPNETARRRHETVAQARSSHRSRAARRSPRRSTTA